MNRPRARSLFITLILAAVAAPGALDAQDVEMWGRLHGTRPPDGYYDFIARYPHAYQFRTALIPYARRIFEARRQTRQAMDLDRLNAHLRHGPSRAAAQASAMAVSGTVHMPLLFFKFANTTNSSLPTAGEIEDHLFTTTPTAPDYSTRTYYDEISRGMITVTGDVYGPFTVSEDDTYYEGSCNGLPGSCSDEHLGELLVEVLDSAEAAGVDFSPYDFDSDGFVDFVAFLHPEIGGECGAIEESAENNLWAHRFVLQSVFVAGNTYSTNDGVTIDDYTMQAGVGGPNTCFDSTAVMPIGVFTHETGHVFGLPDLYDTSGNTEGIGHWGLMGAGNENVSESPAHMMAWSLDQLGWITIDTLLPPSGNRDLTIRPIIESDTAFAVCTAADPANCLDEEYFLLANRARRGADRALKVPLTDGAGLLIWHISPDIIASRTSSNSVNASSPYGVFLEQADGFNHLHSSTGNRGDTGDAWPGSSDATTFGPETNPNSKLNDGSDSRAFIQSIAVALDSTITASFNTGVDIVVQTNVNDGTEVLVDGAFKLSPHETVWGVGTTHTIAVPDTQLAPSGVVRYIFEEWNDVAPPTNSHDVVPADADPDTFTATLRTQNLLTATAGFGGSLTLEVGGGPVTSPHWSETTDVATLTASADPGAVFDAFTGDTTSTDNPLTLAMDRPWTVVAGFMSPVSVLTDSALKAGVMGASYSDTLEASGGNGAFKWRILSGALPEGVELDSLTGELAGVPAETGDFDMTIKAISEGTTTSEEADQAFGLTVTAPSLALTSVVDELLGGASGLSEDEIRYLDLLGNANGDFDVGDFRAFLQSIGELQAGPGTGPGAVAELLGADGRTTQSNAGPEPARRAPREDR